MPRTPLDEPLDDLAADERVLTDLRREELRARDEQAARTAAERELALDGWNRELDRREEETRRRGRGEMSREELRARQTRIAAEDARRAEAGARWTAENAAREALWDAQDARWYANRLRLAFAARALAPRRAMKS